MRPGRFVLAFLSSSLAVLVLSGCGPVISTYLIVSAQAELDGAKAAEAEKYAVYEYTAAQEYLHKAREEQGYADFGPAIDFAFKADEMAKRGTTRASEEKRRQAESPQWEAPSTTGAQPTVVVPTTTPAAPASPKRQR